MNSALSVEAYLFIVIVNVTFAVIGLFSFVQYTRSRIRNNREALLMKQSYDMASIGASAFVHSTKNQLLSNQILYRRMKNNIESGEVDLDKLSDSLETINTINENLLHRIEELHKSVKTRAIQMVPTDSSTLFDKALSLFSEKYAQHCVEVEGDKIDLLLDTNSFTEVLYNLLSNAQDAVNLKHKDSGKGRITLKSYQERIYSVIEISDNGMGMTLEQKNRLFEPFYSNKNSNFNWGMGLHYSLEIVKAHYGTIRFDTVEGEGTTFYVLLPRY
ncbi:sensor histidine kinase [Proteiniclasticum sp. C24MP]|uniref:sensor histidine kinase n=1 Tax=Proteiniclasticum sp. C24MP TaxID=3374101 RepID=UPI0037543BB5